MKLRNISIISFNELRNILFSLKIFFILAVSIGYVALFMLAIRFSPYLDAASFLIPSLKLELPFIIIIPFYISIFFLPLISILSIFDSISYQFDNKSIKYLAYRVPRKNILIAKFIAPFLLVNALNFILYFLFWIYSLNNINGDYSLILFLFFVFSVVYSIFFQMIGFFLSIFHKTPTKSLFSALFFMILLFIIKIFKLNFLTKLSPFEYAASVIQIVNMNFIFNVIISPIIYGIMIILLVFAGYIIFSRKDLY